jgi:hypothetical protein
MDGQCLSPSYLHLPRGRVVPIICVVRGRNHLLLGQFVGRDVDTSM